jgi:DNA-directed RNA polymerase beta' subunit
VLASKALHRDNSVVAMYTSGSKGSLLNISQIVACVGQQSVEGKVRVATFALS